MKCVGAGISGGGPPGAHEIGGACPGGGGAPSTHGLVLAPHVVISDATVGERSNFKKFPTHTQDHGDGIATRGESVVYVPS